MKQMCRRLFSLVLACCLIVSLFPMLINTAEAAGTIVINGVDIGYADKNVLPQKGYFTKNGSTCKDYNNYHKVNEKDTLKDTCHSRNGYDCVKTTDPSCNCMRYWPTGVKGTHQVDLEASQCLGYAHYCQWKVYGTFDSSSFVDLTGTLNASSCTGAVLKSKLMNCAPATHIRTRKVSKPEGKGHAHSICIISTSDSGVRITDCNKDGSCGIRDVTITWDALANEVKPYGGIAYANSWKAGTPVVPTTFFDFWGTVDGETISDKHTFWWKQDGYGSHIFKLF